MTDRSLHGFRANVVSMRRHLRAGRREFGTLLARVAAQTRRIHERSRGYAQQLRRIHDRSRRYVDQLLAQCAAAAAPRVALCPATETLEGRRLLSAVSLSSGVLKLTGDSWTGNSLTVDLQSNGGFWVNADGHIISTSPGAVSSISITGGSGADAVYINPGIKVAATINTYGGNDTIKGGSGYDNITAGDGADKIYGSGKIVVGNGSSAVYVGKLASYVQVGNGNDLVEGGPGNDTLIAGGGHSTLYGGAGADLLEGGAYTTYPDATWQDKVVRNFTSSSTTTVASTTPTQLQSVPSGSVSSSGENETVHGSNHGDSLAPTPVIVLQGTGGQAEHSVFVNALSSSLASGTPLTATYKWNFGDSSGQFNSLTGWNAGHIYNNAGTYTITLTITNANGHTSSVSTQITVGNSTRKTIYVDAVSGNDGYNGLSSSSPVRSWQRADQLLTNNTTVLFHRGQTFYFGNSFMFNNSNIVVGAYGSGNNPVMMKIPGAGHGVFYMGSNSQQVVIENLTFDSVYTPSGNSAPEIDAVGIYPQGHDITVRNNIFLNVNTAVDAYQAPVGLLVQGNVAPNVHGLRAYLVWLNGTDVSILGNTVVNSTREHVVRSSFVTTNRVLIAGNNFDNPAWDGGDSGDTAKTTINIRAGSWVYIWNNKLSDGTVSIGPDSPLAALSVTIPWVKFDGNFLNHAQFFMHGSVQHAMVSNNFSNLEYYQEFEFQPTDPNYPSLQLSDITFTHNTGSQQGPVGSFLQIDGELPKGVITVTDNLFSAPNLQPGNQFATSVFIKANTAGAVALFNHNVWAPAAGTALRYYLPGGVNYISPGYTLLAFLTAQSWDSLPNVGDDQFRTVWVSLGGSLQTSIDGEMAGAVLPAPLS